MTSAVNINRNQSSLEDAKSVLQHLQQGLITIEKNGIVCAPSTDFTFELLGEDLFGNSIFDNLFRRIDSASQLYSQIKTVFLTCFGSSKIQWKLTSYLLPTEIELIVPVKNRALAKESDNQVVDITVSYSPLWDTNNKLEKILVLFSKSKKREQIDNSEFKYVRELINFSVRDLEEYFDSAFSLLKISKDLTKQLNLQPQKMHKILRNMHTLKGNSHLMRMSEVVEKTHKFELKTKTLDFQKTSISMEEKSSTADSLEEVFQTLQMYNRVAHRYLKVSNQHSTSLVYDLNHLLVRAEYLISEISPHLSICLVRDLEADEISCLNEEIFQSSLNHRHLKSLEAILRRTIENSLQLKNSEIENAARAIYEGFQAISSRNLISTEMLKESISAPFHLISRVIQSLFVVHDIPIYYATSSVNFQTIILDIFEISEEIYSQCYDENSNFIGFTSSSNLIEAAKRICKFSVNSNLMYFQASTSRLFSFIEKPSDSSSSEELEMILKDIWRYIQITCLLDSAYRSDSIGRCSQDALILNLKIGKIPSQEIKKEQDRSQNLFFNVLSQLSDRGYHPLSFFRLFDFFVHGKTLAVEDLLSCLRAWSDEFIWKESGLPDLKSYLCSINELKTVDTEKNNDSSDERFKNVLTEYLKFGLNGIRHLKQLDLYYLFEIYIEDEVAILKRIKTQSAVIVRGNSEKLKLAIEEMETNINFENVQNLRSAYDGLFHIPVKPLLWKLCRGSAPLALELGKLVEFKVVGDDISLKSEIATILINTATHLIRNSMDHGIEFPEVRRCNQKDVTAVIEIQCHERNGEVIFRIKDDGSGIDADVVTSEALKMKYITKKQAAEMSLVEKINLIFVPRLSTKTEITEISGFGIGLETVKADIERQGGFLTVSSDLGKSTVFTIGFRK